MLSVYNKRERGLNGYGAQYAEKRIVGKNGPRDRRSLYLQWHNALLRPRAQGCDRAVCAKRTTKTRQISEGSTTRPILSINIFTRDVNLVDLSSVPTPPSARHLKYVIIFLQTKKFATQILLFLKISFI